MSNITSKLRSASRRIDRVLDRSFKNVEKLVKKVRVGKELRVVPFLPNVKENSKQHSQTPDTPIKLNNIDTSSKGGKNKTKKLKKRKTRSKR